MTCSAWSLAIPGNRRNEDPSTRNAFEQAVLYADVLWNDTVQFMIVLITQAIENRPFRCIDGGAEKIIEENISVM